MPRKFGQIYCGIWDDPDFLLLTAAAQRTYMFLISQETITACGTLPLTLRRWAKKCADSNLELWLAELSEAGFVLLDEETEELLVRSFARHDEGYKHSIRRKAVVSSARAVKSPLLSLCIGEELARLGLSIATQQEQESRMSASREPVEPERFQVVTKGDHSGTLDPGTVNPERGTVSAAAPDGLSPFCPDHQPNGTTDACGPCGTWGMAYRLRVKRDAEADIAAKAERAARAAAGLTCPYCQGGTWRIDDPAVKCDHTAPVAVGDPE